MTANRHRLTARASVTALRGALVAVALAGYADGAAAQYAGNTANPISTVEVGVGDVTRGSFKAGEYNGLQDKGALFLNNLDVGSASYYNSASALRWRVKGTDLGLKSRGLAATVGVQGKFRFTFGYDELLRNRSDTYQTPYNGAGTNILTLPATWQVPTVAGSGGTNPISARGLVKALGDAPYVSTLAANNGAVVSPTAAQTALVDAAADADVPLFHNVNLSTTRTKVDVGVSYNVTERWKFDAKFQPEHRDGLKPMGTVSRNVGGDIATIIPDVIDSNNNQITTSVNFTGARSYAQAGYYASFFENDVPFMSWQNWATGPAGTGTVNTISSAPDNRFNQITALYGAKISSTTKVVVHGSYGRSTQNVAFITNPTTPVVPVGSLNGVVVSTAFDAKLTSRPGRRLNLTGGYRFDDRDNRTPISIYQYADAEEAPVANANFPAGSGNPLGAVLAQNANANRPYSRKLNRLDVEADYALAKGQWLKGGYVFERIDRGCTGSWIDCANADTTRDNTLRAEWRADVGQNLNASVEYAYSARRAPTYNENAFLALVPYANVSPVAATGGATAYAFMVANGWNGWGPALGFDTTTGNMNLFFPSNNALANALYANNNRISELPGMRRYFVADRDRNTVRTLLNWQAAERLSVQGGVDFTGEHYPTSTYGLQDARSWAVDVDGSYTLADNVTASLFYTYEKQRSLTAGNTYTANSNVASIANSQPGVVGLSGNSCDGYTTLQQRNNNNKLDPCLNWSANMLDNVNTLGLGLRQQTGKLDVTADLVFTRQRSDNNVSGGNWANNILNGPGAAPTTVAAWFIAATPLPTVTARTAEVRLNGRYAISARHSVRVAYSYLRMSNADWMYEGMQVGSLSSVLPSHEQPFNYGVHIVGVSYVLTF